MINSHNQQNKNDEILSKLLNKILKEECFETFKDISKFAISEFEGKNIKFINI